MNGMHVPVAIVFFNRLEPLKKLVARLAEAKPPRVYLISDGARKEKTGEFERVEACRTFMRKLPWACEIRENFASENLGCRKRVTSGLDWVFAQEERAIILEDDCIPEPEFFTWAEKMLDRYKDEPKVLSIGGTNLRPQLCDQSKDCMMTKYAMIWGWATWRRAWIKNEKDLANFLQACRIHKFKKWLGKWRAEWYWRYLLTHVKSSWGYRWAFTHFVNEAYCVVPPVNLVENIGMTDALATHTSDNPYELAKSDRIWRMANKQPGRVVSNDKLDCWTEDHQFSRSFIERLKWLGRKIRNKMR